MIPRFWIVEPADWSDRPVAIIGAGPSLMGHSLASLKKHAYSIAVTASIFDYPWVSLGFGLDYAALLKFWDRFGVEVQMPIYWAIPDSCLKKPRPSQVSGDLRLLYMLPGITLSDNPSIVCGGGTSGFGALNLAWLKGARGLIVLFGFDYASDGHGNWHRSEFQYDMTLSYNEQSWRIWAGYFSHIASKLAGAGCRVVNASPTSTIDAFPKVSVAEGLRLIEEESRNVPPRSSAPIQA